MIPFRFLSPAALAAFLALNATLSLRSAEIADKVPAPGTPPPASDKTELPATSVNLPNRPPAPPKAPAPGINASPSLKLATAERVKVGPGGFLSHWFLLDPIPGDGRVTEGAIRAAAEKEYFPNQLSFVPRKGDIAKAGEATLAWQAVDSSTHNVNLYHFAFYQGKPTTNQVFWGVTTVEVPEDMSNVRLAVGSNSGSIWWINGEEKVALYGDIQTFIDDTASKRFTLKKGTNVVRFMVVNNGGMVDCCARFLNESGQPITNLTQFLSLSSK